MNKKIRKVLLAFLLTITVILAGKVLADNSSTEGKITVNKVATKDIGIEGNETYGRKSKVTLSVTGNEFTTSSTLDVVLVLDRSSSMHKNNSTKLSDAKEAAVELAETLLANNTKDRTVVKMAVVTFGKTVIDKWSNSTLSANVTDVTSKINAITSRDSDIPGNTNGQGTNIQSGLAKANELLKDSTAKNKVVILLTDGEPTLFNYNGVVKGSGSSDEAACIEENWYGGCTKELKPSDAAKTEATTLRNAGVELYTVGFGLKDNAYDSKDTKESKANARAFLQSIATKNESPYYLLAENKSELTNSFSDIVKSMTTIATNVVVEDIVPVGFEVNGEELKNTYGDSVTVTNNSDGTTTITWKIGNLTVTNDPSLTYEVIAKDDYYGGMYTNTEAVLTGTATTGNPSYPTGKIEEVFPLPVVAIPSITNNDNYTAKLGETLTVIPTKGILINDTNIKLEEGKNTKVEDEIIIKSTTCGNINDIKVNDDGSFEYTPNSSCYLDNDEVTFEYEIKSTVTIDGVEYEVISNTSTITIDLTKDESKVKDPTVTKVNNNGDTTTSITGPFDYTINYTTIIENHIGATTITIVDKLPYELDLTKENNLDGGIYNKDNKTITWVETINNIDSYKNQNNSIKIEKTIKVFYQNVPTNIETIKNTATVTTNIDNKPVKTEEETKVVRGKVTAEYIDTLGNTLKDSVTTQGLIDTTFETTATNVITVDGVEYQLVATKLNGIEVEKTNNYTGKYTKEDTTVTYIYYQVTGDIDKDQTILTKEGPEIITTSNGIFNYTITYESKIDNYIGDATVTIIDTLPYELDLTASNLNGGKYNATNKTITWVENITNIDTFTNGTYPVKVVKTINLVFKDLDATNRTLINKVDAKLETNKSTKEDKTEEVTELAIKGNVIAHYIDINNNTISEDIKTTDLVGNDYTTKAKTINGYKLIETRGEVTGTYIDGTIEVTYVYYKVEGNITDDTITKTGTNEVTKTDATFEYEITYNAVIKNYIGNATVTIVDTLPYELDLTANYDLDGGIYDKETKTITWVEDITNIDTNKNGQYLVEYVKNIKVTYLGIDPTTRVVTNNVVGTIKTEVTEEKTEPAEKDTAVKVSGNVIANYVDTIGNTLIPSITTNGLVGDTYTTTTKTIEGYKLVEIKGETTGTYIDGTIEVTYVYYKVEGNIDNNNIIKTGTEEVTSTDATFEYTVTYNTIIKDYIGNATVTIVDTLPYELDLNKDYDLDGGIYDKETKTITWIDLIENIDTNQTGEYKVAISKNIKVTYLGIDPTTRIVTNSVIGTIKTDIKEETTEPSIQETLVKVQGDVLTHYVDTLGNTLIPSTKTTGLVGDTYTTSAKEIAGYELVEVQGNTTGKYTEEPIEVTYIYYRETGEILGDTITKEGTDEVFSTNAIFNYTINYNAIIKDYIGNATVTIIDTLPYELDLTTNYDLAGGIYDKETKTITWIENITNIDTNKNGEYKVEITKNIKLAYAGIDPTTRIVTNSVIGTIKTDIKEETTEPSIKDTTVSVSGNVIANYVDTLGNVIAESVKTSGLVGNEYVTSEKVIDGYELVKIEGNPTGNYTLEDTIVNYIYYKETGNITKDSVEKIGSKEIITSQDKVNYTINYKANLDNYIGNALVTIIDYLPYELDLTASDLAGGIYDEDAKTITWTITLTNIDTLTNGTYNIDITKNLILSYKDIDLTSDIITNKVTATLKTDVSESTKEDSTDTEVNVNGIVEVHYVDELGNILKDTIILSGKVGTTYETNKLVIDGYIFVNAEGEVTGEYIDGKKIVTYIYTVAGKGGDVEELPPQTGANNNVVINLIISLITSLVILIKRLF